MAVAAVDCFAESDSSDGSSARVSGRSQELTGVPVGAHAPEASPGATGTASGSSHGPLTYRGERSGRSCGSDVPPPAAPEVWPAILAETPSSAPATARPRMGTVRQSDIVAWRRLRALLS